MRYTLSVLFFIYFPFLCLAQKQSFKITGVTNIPVKVESSVVGFPSAFLQKGSIVYIRGAYRQNNRNYFDAYYNNKSYSIESKDLVTSTSFENVLNFSKSDKDSLETKAKSVAELRYNSEKQVVSTTLSAHRQAGLTVIEFSPKDESEYTDGTGLKIEVFNPTKKIIKYIWFYFVGINPVGDKVLSNGTSMKSVKSVGPIPSGETASYNFEYVWFTDLVEKVEISNIKVEYMDRTFKTIKNPKSIILDHAIYRFVVLDGEPYN